jgi:2-oxoglutarate ferredoxin oxidoreductase subunit beta
MMLEQEYDAFLSKYFRMERLPHIWCPGCGIGTAMHSLVHAIDTSGIDLDTIVAVSGIGCSGRAAGYLNFDSFHVLHGRAIPFAVGLKLANPKLNLVVFSGDGDLFAIGGNHFIHAARRNHDILVICVNNFNYGMTGGQCGPTSPLESFTTTSPYGCIEPAFNLPWLAASCGATYVARWTILHVRQLTNTIVEALQKKGFRFIEILSPCPVNFGRRNELPTGIDELKMYQKYSTVANFADPKIAEIKWENEIVVGKFVDKEQPTYEERLRGMIDRARGVRRE